MQLAPITTLAGLPGYLRLAVSVMFVGLASSIAVPYISLYAVREVGMSPLALGVFMTSISASGILISTRIGRWSDRRASRREVVLLTALAAALGYALLGSTREYLTLLLIGCVLLGTGAAAFPQLFAHARAQLTPAGRERAEHGVTALRTVVSLAWVLGPAAGALVIEQAGFTPLFLTTGALFILAALPLMLRERPAAAPPVTPRHEQPGPAVASRNINMIALSFALYGTTMSMSSISLPILVTGALGGTTGDVGFLIGLCALLEIPVMLSFVLLARRHSNERMNIAAFALFAAYYALIAVSHAVWVLALAQALRAVAMAITATLGMAYFQELMPNRPGAATTLYVNTGSVGAIVGGIFTGVLAEAFGFRSVFVVCAALSLVAWAVLFAVSRQPLRGPGAG